MNNIRVLVLDDHEVVRRGICDILDRADGIEVVAEAGTVAQAVRRADAVRPDVVLSDLRLPDGTGLELIAHVRQEIEQMPYRPLTLPEMLSQRPKFV